MHTKTLVADDLEIHTSTVLAAGRKFFEVRQYIPSLKQYGRGVTMPHTTAMLSAIRQGAAMSDEVK